MSRKDGQMDTDRAISRAIEALEDGFARLDSDEDKRRFLVAVDEWTVNVEANNLPEGTT